MRVSVDIPFWGFKSVFKSLHKGHSCSLPKGPIVTREPGVNRFFEAAVSCSCCLYLSPEEASRTGLGAYKHLVLEDSNLQSNPTQFEILYFCRPFPSEDTGGRGEAPGTLLPAPELNSPAAPLRLARNGASTGTLRAGQRSDIPPYSAPHRQIHPLTCRTRAGQAGLVSATMRPLRSPRVPNHPCLSPSPGFCLSPSVPAVTSACSASRHLWSSARPCRVSSPPLYLGLDRRP